jgi:hypothetical protein
MVVLIDVIPMAPTIQKKDRSTTESDKLRIESAPSSRIRNDAARRQGNKVTGKKSNAKDAVNGRERRRQGEEDKSKTYKLKEWSLQPHPKGVRIEGKLP